MPIRTYIERTFRPDALLTIQRANDIAVSYSNQGFDLTLRQLYYQFVSRGWIPNKDTEYKRLGGIINDARLAGYLDWDFITDRTRNLRDLSHWNDPSEIVDAVARQYREDKWTDQPEYVEVWIEKDALVGVLDFIYYSDSYDEGGNGYKDLIYNCKDALLNHLTIERIALNWDQVQQYNPPPNPAKISDSRAEGYIRRFGQQSWELDALDPATLVGLIQNEIDNHKDFDIWDDSATREDRRREVLRQASQNWQAVEEFLEGVA